MLRTRSETQLPICAVPGIRPVLQECLIMLLCAGVLCIPALRAQTPESQPAAPAVPSMPSMSSKPLGFVGAETCATCHEDIAWKFASNPHAKMSQMHGSNGVTCENCHGAGKAHVEGNGDVTKIFNPAKATAKEVNAKCQSCHAGAHPNFDHSPHAKADMSCLNCHSIHTDSGQKHLLKAEQPKLCFQCHNDVKPAFAMPFHHKVIEGLVTCSDCHDVHDAVGRNDTKSTADQNAICTKCHTQLRGPFVYEHGAVKAEGCMACHTPHGSQNAQLLRMPNSNALCSQCHSPVETSMAHKANAESSSATPCISCHTAIHGSNLNQVFLK